MSGFKRAIDIAFDRVSGEVLEAEQVFDTQKNSFELRRQFHRDEVELFCRTCEQKLYVSTSSRDRLYFRHGQGHERCLLTDFDISPGEAENIRRIIHAKESPRHKQLKQLIADRLRMHPDVDASSISTDDRFIFDGTEKRRPDVYCRYKDKKLVFEIQLSDLSLRYILDRHEFYRRKGIYLIWVLDNYDVHGQSQMNRDIKHLSAYHNFFRMDESATDFKMICDYKYHFLTLDNELHTKWTKRSVTLDELQFDWLECQAYYFDYVADKRKWEQQQVARKQATADAQKQKQEQQRLAAAQEAAGEIIDEIGLRRTRGIMYYDPVEALIAELDEQGEQALNDRLRFRTLRSGGVPVLNKYFREAKRIDNPFLGFLLCNEKIHLEVNAMDENGITAFQELFSNPEIISKYSLTRQLLARGYRLTPGDYDHMSRHSDASDRRQMPLYTILNRLQDRRLVQRAANHSSLLYILESAKNREIAGFNYASGAWLAFANNAIHDSYARHWRYIEYAFRKYGIWNLILDQDRKTGSFSRKLAQRIANMPPQDYELDDVFSDLYLDPDIQD